MTTLAEAIVNCIRSSLTPFKGDVITIIAKMLSDGLLSDERFHELHKEIDLLMEYYQQDLENLGFSSEAIHEAIYKPITIISEETNDGEIGLSEQIKLQAKIRLAKAHGLILTQSSMDMGFNSGFLSQYLVKRFGSGAINFKLSGIKFKIVSDYIDNFLEKHPNRISTTNIKDMRLKAGLTQNEVSIKANIPRSKYMFIEKKQIPINKDIATKLSAVFGCEVPYSE